MAERPLKWTEGGGGFNSGAKGLRVLHNHHKRSSTKKTSHKLSEVDLT